MSTRQTDPPPPVCAHPVVEFAQRLTARLEQVAEIPVWSMDPAAQRTTLVELAKARAQLEALQLRVLAEAETTGACLEAGAVNSAGWVAAETRQTRREARADLKLAGRLGELPALSAAMASGGVNPAQARAIVAALDGLPTRREFALTAEQLAHAEAHLVGLAASYDAVELRLLGRALVEVIAPDVAEELLGRRLEAEEAAAARRTTLVMWDDDQGTCQGRFRVPVRHGQMLRKALWSLTNPTRRDNNDPGEEGDTAAQSSKQSPIDPDLPAPVRFGVAFTQILEAIESHWLPTSGGVGATVVVTMTDQQLLADLDAAGVCTLDTGGQISAAEARRLACRAGIIPMVLGSRSVVLDAGTRTRFHSEPMRIAMGLRDGGCTAQGCDVPASMCHAHHELAFSQGGATSVANGRLLCGHHHRRIHDPAYGHRQTPDGKIAFYRRT